MTSSQKNIRIGLSIGDPNGIGPEIALKAAQHYQNQVDIEITLIGDTHVLNRYADLLKIKLDCLNIHDVKSLAFQDLKPGEVTPAAGHATIDYLKAGITLFQESKIDALVAAPHHETAVNSAGINFSGYPGKIAELTNTPADEVFIMLVGKNLKITHVTLHEGLEQALHRINEFLVFKAGLATFKTLSKFGFKNPSLGIFGINPHASENGLFGKEDLKATFPAAQKLRDAGYICSDPQGADVLLASQKYDAYLAMYHDQGHIPIKLIAPNQASALTIGTPILFSSVAHGTAMDIAGKGVANADAIINSIKVIQGLFQ